MKKIVAAIFAHPDDEAFGPSGTIAKYVKEDADVYLLCATKGEGGENHLLDKDERSIFEIREEELQNSAKALGVKQVFFLGFTDGTLCNNLYHKIADKILEILTPLNPEILITNEPRGVSGHIDHVTISMVTSYVFNKLPSAKTILYHCISEEYRNRYTTDYFIYIPPGYKKSEIDKVVDVSSVWKEKTNAILSHKSQSKDAQRILNRINNFRKEEYFLVKNK